MTADVDVLIVGAGISGIALGYELSRRPHLSFEILEKRQRIGGTWDIFTYPGVRSDSEMDSYCFSFAPWRGSRPLGSGPEIRQYLEQVAVDAGLLEKTTFGAHVHSANWDSTQEMWQVETSVGQKTARFLHIAGGYFNHEEGYLPDFPGKESFAGQLIQPQKWPAELEWAGKKVVVIGSGATAATLVPELAKTAQVTMLQRSPSHMAAMANHVPKLPDRLQRARAIAQNQLIIALAKRAPKLLDRALDAGRSRILPEDQRAHFRPDYPVWDQRVCRIPDGDLFHAIADGKVKVVTDGVEKLCAEGVVTSRGQVLPADIIVAATGLKLQALGGVALAVDGGPVEVGQAPAYRGCMLQGVPNLSFTMGYVNESFTLRAELVAQFVAGLADTGRVVTPAGAPGSERRSIIDLKSGYVRRGIAEFPFVTESEPYALHNNHYREAAAFRRPEGLNFGYSWPAGIRARVEGPVDGEPVVLLHGIGRSLEDFDEISLEGKRLIALDTPGFGQTPALGHPTMGGIAKALWRAIDELVPGKSVTLVGNSLGGALAMRMAVLHPDRVAKVVLLAPSGFSEDITQSVKIAASAAGPLFLKAAGGPLLEKVERAVVSEDRFVTAKALDVGRRNATADSRRTFIALSKELVGTPANQRTEVAKEFAATGIATHIIWGSEDNILPVSHLATARAILPHASVTELAGVGHIIQRERPAEVCRAVGMT